MNKPKERQPIQVEDGLKEIHVAEIIRGMLLSPGLRQEALTAGLEPKYFTGSWYVKYGLLLRTIMDLKAENLEVTYVSVFGHMVSMLSNQTAFMEPTEQALLMENSPTGLIWQLFYMQHPLSTEYWRKLVKRFLEERQIFARVRSLVEMTEKGRCPIGMADFTERLHRDAQRMAMVSASPEVSYRETLREPLRTLRPTTVSFLDDVTGGQADNEVYGLYGPFGSGKSLLGQTIAVDSAKFDREAHLSFGKPLRHWYVLSYELSKQQALLRLMTCLGKISSKSAMLWMSNDYNNDLLSTSNDPTTFKDYEKKLFAMQYSEGVMLGERERVGWIDEALEGPHANLHLWDMSGKDDKRAQVGQGYVAEIEALLTREKDEFGRAVGGVVIDYADLVADRYLIAKGLDRDRQLRHYVGAPFAEAVVRQVACRFTCPVWVLYQFDTRVNKCADWYLGTHGDGAGGKDSARGLDYCFVMSKTNADGYSRFGCSKHRYGLDDTPNRQPVEVLRNRGDIGRMEPAADFVFDNTQKKVVSRRDLQGWRPSAALQDAGGRVAQSMSQHAVINRIRQNGLRGESQN